MYQGHATARATADISHSTSHRGQLATAHASQAITVNPGTSSLSLCKAFRSWTLSSLRSNHSQPTVVIVTITSGWCKRLPSRSGTFLQLVFDHWATSWQELVLRKDSGGPPTI